MTSFIMKMTSFVVVFEDDDHEDQQSPGVWKTSDCVVFQFSVYFFGFVTTNLKSSHEMASFI